MSFLEGIFRAETKRWENFCWRLSARDAVWMDGLIFCVSISGRKQSRNPGLIRMIFYANAGRMKDCRGTILTAASAAIFCSKEKQKSAQHIATEDCRLDGCQDCGVCDFSAVKNILAEEDGNKNILPPPVDDKAPIREAKYRFTFSKTTRPFSCPSGNIRSGDSRVTPQQLCSFLHIRVPSSSQNILCHRDRRGHGKQTGIHGHHRAGIFIRFEFIKN